MRKLSKVSPHSDLSSIDSLVNGIRSPREQETEFNDYSFDNFNSHDFSELKIKTAFYNEIESKWIKERRQAKSRHPGRSIASIKSNPFKRAIDLTSSGTISIISDHFLLGSKKDAGNLDLLNKLGVSHVLNVAQQVPNYFPNHFLYLKIPLVDSSEINVVECVQSVVMFLSHIEAINGRVLIHCISG